MKEMALREGNAATPAGQAYSGTDNLEAMACAVNYNRFLLELLTRNLQPRDRVLDFGAGIGTFARRLCELGHEVCAVEPDGAQRAVIAQSGVRCAAALDDYAAESFDFIYSFNVLEHIEDDVATLTALRSRLRVGGRLLLYVPAFPFLFTSMDRKVGHLRRYTARALQRRVQAAGLHVERWRYADSLGVAATLVYKLAGDRGGSIDEFALAAYDRIAFPISRSLDSVFGRIGGKNVWVCAIRPERQRG